MGSPRGAPSKLAAFLSYVHGVVFTPFTRGGLGPYKHDGCSHPHSHSQLLTFSSSICVLDRGVVTVCVLWQAVSIVASGSLWNLPFLQEEPFRRSAPWRLTGSRSTSCLRAILSWPVWELLRIELYRARRGMLSQTTFTPTPPGLMGISNRWLTSILNLSLILTPSLAPGYISSR